MTKARASVLTHTRLRFSLRNLCKGRVFDAYTTPYLRHLQDILKLRAFDHLAGVAARAFGLAADVRGQLLDAAPNI